MTNEQRRNGAGLSRAPWPLMILGICRHVGLVIAIVLVASAYMTMSKSADAEVTRESVRQYAQDLYGLIAGSNEILDGALAKESIVAGATWLDLFALMLTAERVTSLLQEGQYGRAVAQSAAYGMTWTLTSHSVAAATVSSALALGNLASLPYQWMLRVIANNAQRAQFDAQVEMYLMARSEPFGKTHAFLLAGESDADVEFFEAPRGWIKGVGVGETGPIRTTGRTGPGDPAEVFGQAEKIFIAQAAAARLEAERHYIDNTFRQLLAEATDSPPLEGIIGTWSGIYHCSDRGDRTGRIEWNVRETDDGALVVEENSYRNGRHEFEVYTLEFDERREVYVGRSGNYRMEFRVQRVQHLVSLDGAYIGYAPCDTFLLSPGGAPVATPAISIEQPLAGRWSGIFHCDDKGSSTGEVVWEINYDEKDKDIFRINEEKRRDGKERSLDYRGKFDIERGHYMASRFAWHVLFRLEDSGHSLRGIYWPDTGRMFERCREIELSRIR